MTRSFKAAVAAIALLAAPAMVHAQTFSVTYATSDLATAAGRNAVKAKVAASADSFCRANPKAGATVAACRRDVTSRLSQVVDQRAQQYAQTQSTIRLARR